MKHTLITFPRSGAHYFQNYLFQSTGYKIDKTHDPLKDISIVTVARNPTDSISSMVAMLCEYNDELPIDVAVQRITENYEQFYIYLDNHADMVFDYEDLISSPEKVAQYFSNASGLEYSSIDYEDDIRDMPDKRHVRTSIYSKAYGLSKDMLISNTDKLAKANDLYLRLLSKKIVL
jgi:hypothetical protein